MRRGRINGVVKSLNLMGYEVEEGAHSVIVLLQSKSGKIVATEIPKARLYDDWIVEHIVNHLNNIIKEELY